MTQGFWLKNCLFASVERKKKHFDGPGPWFRYLFGPRPPHLLTFSLLKFGLSPPGFAFLGCPGPISAWAIVPVLGACDVKVEKQNPLA